MFKSKRHFTSFEPKLDTRTTVAELMSIYSWQYLTEVLNIKTPMDAELGEYLVQWNGELHKVKADQPIVYQGEGEFYITGSFNLLSDLVEATQDK